MKFFFSFSVTVWEILERGGDPYPELDPLQTAVQVSMNGMRLQVKKKRFFPREIFFFFFLHSTATSTLSPRFTSIDERLFPNPTYSATHF